MIDGVALEKNLTLQISKIKQNLESQRSIKQDVN